MAGRVAYAQQFVDAFRWWLAEKAEWFLKETVNDESVLAGIPPARSWDELAAKKKWTSPQLKKAQAVRGKLNVPREWFRQIGDGQYIWAGKD